MHPILIRLGSLEIHTYGVLVACGFLFGILTAQRRAKREGIEPERIGDLGVWLIVSAMLGAKIFHIIFFWNDFLAGWREVGISSLRSGFVFYGGFVGATTAGIIYAKVKKLPLWKLADIFAPSIALGHAFGRVGCFFEGCCYGKECLLPWAVHFPPPHAMAGVGVHPTELYEAAGNLAICGILIAFYHRRRYDGQIWWAYVFLYGALRFNVEFFRGDYSVHYFDIFTTAQFMAIALIIVALIANEIFCRHTCDLKTAKQES
jgi:phosphatidylglycerol:prolipoprotein diacylglycerol transferase